MPASLIVTIAILILLGAFCIAKKFVRFVIDKLDKRIERYIKENLEGEQEEALKEAPKTVKDDIKKEIAIFRILYKKKKETKLGRITVYIGFIEFFIFAVFTAIILFNTLSTGDLSHNLFQIVSRIGIVIPAWIALKIFGGYKQWSGAILGRSTYYIFLIGSIVNILAGILTGIVLYLSWFFISA